MMNSSPADINLTGSPSLPKPLDQRSASLLLKQRERVRLPLPQILETPCQVAAQIRVDRSNGVLAELFLQPALRFGSQARQEGVNIRPEEGTIGLPNIFQSLRAVVNVRVFKRGPR